MREGHHSLDFRPSPVPVQGDLGHQRHIAVYFRLQGEEEVFLPGTETRKSRGEAEILAEIPISTRKFCVPPFVPVRTAAQLRSSL